MTPKQSAQSTQNGQTLRKITALQEHREKATDFLQPVKTKNSSKTTENKNVYTKGYLQRKPGEK